jgi:putative membrane protein
VFPWLKQAIADNQTSAGLLLGGFSVGIGVLNAACLTY